MRWLLWERDEPARCRRSRRPLRSSTSTCSPARRPSRSCSGETTEHSSVPRRARSRLYTARSISRVAGLVAVVNAIVLEEAVELAEAGGLCSELALQVMGAGAGASFVATHRAELTAMAVAGTNGVTGQVGMSLKDLRAVLDEGRARGVGLPINALATQYVGRLFAARLPDAVGGVTGRDE